MMKKFLFVLIAILSIGLVSCEDNSSVKEIAAIIEEHSPAYGDNHEVDPDNMFIRPDGNVFANPQIKAIIEEHAGYKLTEEDKQILNDAIDKFIPKPEERYYTPGADRMLHNLQQTERNAAKANINSATKLGDLIK